MEDFLVMEHLYKAFDYPLAIKKRQSQRLLTSLAKSNILLLSVLVWVLNQPLTLLPRRITANVAVVVVLVVLGVCCGVGGADNALLGVWEAAS